MLLQALKANSREKPGTQAMQRAETALLADADPATAPGVVVQIMTASTGAMAAGQVRKALGKKLRLSEY